MCKFGEQEEPEVFAFLSEGKQHSKSEDYLKDEFQEIKNFRKKVSIMNIFKRKKIAKNEYKEYLKNNNNKNININDENNGQIEAIKSQYIKIFCLLLIDNTNKNIVKLYLDFIKKYPKFIKENNL